MMKRFFPVLPALVTATLIATEAQAYVGPGAGLGAIAATLAVVVGVVLLLVGFLWFPLKRLLKGGKAGATAPRAAKADPVE